MELPISAHLNQQLSAFMNSIYFNESRLKMSSAGRFLVRLVSYSAYAVVTAAAVTFSFSDLPSLKSVGWLLVLFLIDRVFHIGKAERSLAQLLRSRRAVGFAYDDARHGVESVNVALYLVPQSYAILEWAIERSATAGGNLPLFVLRKLVDRREVRNSLVRMDVKVDEFIKKIDDELAMQGARDSKAEILKQIESLAVAALTKAINSRSSAIEPKDLFSALSVIGDGNISRLFSIFDIDEGDLESALIFGRFSRSFAGFGRLPRSLTGFIGRSYRSRHRVMNRAWTARPTPTLDDFSEDLTDLARSERVGFLVGHQVEYDRLLDVLSRPGNPNALLIGDPGTGKETIIAHFAYELTKDRVPPPLFDKRLVKLDIGRLVAGAAEGDLQARLKRILDEIVRAGNVILYIPDIHNLTKTSGAERMSAADILLPAIKSSDFSVIGTTYPREFKQLIEPSTEFASTFEAIKIQELSEVEAVRFLVYDSIILEHQYGIMISFGAIKEAVRIAKQYFRQKLLPASAEDLIKEVLADVAGRRGKMVGINDVIAVAEQKVNVPLHKAGKEEAEKLLNLEAVIHERLVDQKEAVREVAQALREYRSGLSRKGGPIAAFLFVGPTGVGKTELSKILAKIKFGSSEVMIRFDMSEYQDKATVNRLLDNVTGTVREKPYSLLLLDEFEKAHGDILNLFLQVFDDGRLTDGLGRTVDFQNTIIISTSNAHSDFIKSEIERGVAMKQIAEQLKKKLTDYFRPELLNRFSDVVVFKNLSPEDIMVIARIQLNDLAKQVREAQGIDIIFDDSAATAVAELGYDPVFGARPLRNVISDRIKAVLAEKILRGEAARGGTMRVIFKNNEFRFL